jgi:LmbE family N-acetylglucosaminyl deacetylase
MPSTVLMKPGPNSPAEVRSLLAFGAHPDDVEFGAGGILAREARAGTKLTFILCSRGEAASHGTPAEREAEARRSAQLLGAAAEFIDLGGDAHLTSTPEMAILLARAIRRHRPTWILAPTPEPNQHPDHAALGRSVRDAARLARYGGVAELQETPAHAIELLLHYAVGPEGEPAGESGVWFDISDPEIMATWKAAMEAHASQVRARDYVELQLTRARLLGLRAGVGYAQALYPADPLLVDGLAALGQGARRF